MLTLILFIFLFIGISTINGNRCACCFPGQPPICQTPAIDLPSCADCTSFFCANHVKGCQGQSSCTAECVPDSSSTSTSTTSSSSMEPIITTIRNGGSPVQAELIMISVGLTLLTFVQLNF